MKISLRPHHFLCLQGYKGLNYSKANAKSWNKICEALNQNPETDILVTEGYDDLCSKCPAILNSKKSRCVSESVNSLDKKIQNLLSLTTGKTYKYNNIAEKLQTLMTKKLHETLCSNCAWWKKGLCKDTFTKNM